MSKNNIKIKYRSENKQQVVKGKLLPKIFLNKRGIKPFASQDLKLLKISIANEIRKIFGQNEFEKFLAYRDANDAYDYMNSQIFLTKLLYRADYYQFCMIANELRDITVPSASKILDIGGGTGLLAFYMAEIWQDSEITVADKYSDTGMQWAKEIGVSRVFFKDSLLPDLKDIPDQHYDVIVLSRVLGNMNVLSLPTCINVSWEDYSVSPEGIHLFNELKKIANSLKRVMKQDGLIIIIDSWSGDRVRIIGKAFEEEGLFIDIEKCYPDRLSINYSFITFSRSSRVEGVEDMPLALSTKVDEETNATIFKDVAAESLKNLFQSSPPVMEFEYTNDDQSRTIRTEIFEKDGIALNFSKFSEGSKIAAIFSTADIPKHVKMYREFENKAISEGKDIIIQGVTIRK